VVSKKLIAVIVVVIIVGAIGGYYYVGSQGSTATTQSETTIAQQSTQSSMTGVTESTITPSTQLTSSTQTMPLGQVTIAVSGAFAIYPLMVTWAQEYHSINPNVQIEVSAGGAGKGMSDVLGGLVDIGMVSRNISQAELQKGAYPIEIVKGGVVAIVSPSNPVLAQVLSRGLSKSILEEIFVYGNVTTWGQAIGQPPTPNGPVQLSDKIDVYTRSDSSGAATSWAAYLGNKAQEDLVGVGVYGDTGILEAVQTDPNGIGYVNLPYAYDNSTGKQVSGIVVVPLDLKNNGIIDSRENFYATRQDVSNAVATGLYPVRTDDFLVTKGKPTGATEAFLIWILSDGQKYVTPEGFVQLPSTVIAQELARLQS
jgi:phosphate transport system substrate-binding protein